MSGLSNRERALKVASADLFDDAVGKYELASDVIPIGVSSHCLGGRSLRSCRWKENVRKCDTTQD